MGKWFKKSLALLLILVMCVSMAGCKKETGESTPQGDVYVASFSEMACDFQWISNTISNGNVISLIGQQYSTTDTDVYSYAVINVDANTGEQTKVELDFGENTYLQSIIAVENGYLASMYESIEPTEEELESGIYEYEVLYKLVQYDMGFNVTGEIDLTPLAEKVEEDGNWFYVNSFAVDAENNIYICTDTTIWVLDSEGNILFDVTFASWVNGLTATKDGQVVVLYYNDEYETVASIIDTNTKAVGPELENIPAIDNATIYPASEGKLYMSNSANLYVYDINTQTYEEVLNWINCDINTDYIRGFAALEDGTFVVVTATTEYKNDEPETTVEFARISKVPASSVVNKKIITLAMLYLDYGVRESVIKFNKTNPDYRIEVKTYINDDYSNYDDATTLFSTDIVSGNIADIVIIPPGGNVSVENLAAKGVLADLYELIDNDPDMAREDFITNILEAQAIDGKLYGIGDSFSVLTLVGKASDVGTGSSWNFKDVKNLLEKKPEAMLLQYLTKEYGLQFLTQYGMQSFYDKATGACNFNSQEFIDVLELANSFPEEANYNGEYESFPSLVRSGKVLLSDIFMTGFEEIQLYTAIFEEDVNFIGYPTSTGSGSIAQFDNLMAISAKSKNKEGAWQFIRQFMLPDYQDDMDYKFPVNKNAFENLLTKAMAEEANSSWGYDGVTIEITKLTEKEAQQIRDLVYGITATANYDSQINMIITEEAAAYFEGQKSVQEVADIIQSRVQLYINESR